MGKKYKFAGIEFEILIPEEFDLKNEGCLRSFRTEYVTAPHQFYFNVVEEVDAPVGQMVVRSPGNLIYQSEQGFIRYGCVVETGWRKAYYRVESRGRKHFVQVRRSECGGKIGSKTILNVLGAERLLLEKNGIILHSAFIKYEGKGILFTAPSGTGKSTQADLWMKLRGTEIVNGDRAAVRLANGQIIAEGIPFAGSSKYCKNRSLPIVAIVYLDQAPKTSIERLRGYRAFAKIWEGVSVNSWDKEDVEKVSAIVQEIATQVPVYYLSCTPDESAVIALENALQEMEEVSS